MSDQTTPTITTGPFGLTTGRLVALVTPVAATVMGGLAAWLFQHFPGLDSIVPQETAAASLTTGAIWVSTAAFTWAMSHKWLDGFSKWERGVFSDNPGKLPLVYTPEAAKAIHDDLAMRHPAQPLPPTEPTPPPEAVQPPPGDLTKFETP